MKFGFAKNDITPPVGVELCGFGPFLMRRSIGVRDRLWARALAVEDACGQRAVLVACDLIGLRGDIVGEIRARLAAAEGLAPELVMVTCSHTHSGPSDGSYIGWGEAYPPYVEMLPGLVVTACQQALARLEEGVLAHARVPCEGIGLNREYDVDAPPLADVLREDWRPAKPELTDTTCHVLAVRGRGRLLGFVGSFGCHPVVCCQETRFIHGDYCGVATNMLEREHPGSVGLFLQGAQGDVNTCVVHKPETESLLALDVIAARYARSLRAGLAAACPVEAEYVAGTLRHVAFSRKPWDEAWLVEKLHAYEAPLRAHETLDSAHAANVSREHRMNMVYALGVRNLLARLRAGEDITPPTVIAGLRIGPVAILGSPFETFQAIKNDVTAQARAPIPLVTGFVNDSCGYAPDRTAAARGGYAADVVPLIMAQVGFANIHDELVAAHLETDRLLADMATGR